MFISAAPRKGPPGRNEVLGLHHRVLPLRPGPVHLPVLSIIFIYPVPPPTHSPPRRQTCFHSIHIHPSFIRPHRSPATHRPPSFPSCFGCTGQRTSGDCWIYIILRSCLRLFYAPCCVCSCLPAICSHYRYYGCRRTFTGLRRQISLRIPRLLSL